MSPPPHREEAVSATPDPRYPTELRLAVETVAAGEQEEGSSASDTYGLRAELEAKKGGDEEGDDPQDQAASAPEPGAAEPVEDVSGELDTIEEADETPAPAEVQSRETPEGDPSASGAPVSVSDARARLEAFERSIVEKTEALRERAAELAGREQELVETGKTLDELEALAEERARALEGRAAEIEAKEDELLAEAERLEQEQAIWGEATRESKNRLTEREEALETRQQELAAAEERQTLKVAELEALAAALSEREAELARSQAEIAEKGEALTVRDDELAARETALADREREIESALADREREMHLQEEGLLAQEEELTAREDRVAGREKDASAREAAASDAETRLLERETTLDAREQNLVARETALGADAERVERERADWDEMMHGAFSRLNELETDLVSSLSLAGMLKRELEGRESVAERKERRPAQQTSARSTEADGARSTFRRKATTESPADGLAELDAVESGDDAGDVEAAVESADEVKASENDWWARQLGRRKKD